MYRVDVVYPFLSFTVVTEIYIDLALLIGSCLIPPISCTIAVTIKCPSLSLYSTNPVLLLCISLTFRFQSSVEMARH